ncbi:hypothetical protein BgiBS90_026208 [Biomphalaria glabrata]|nr:hypothetical protein BgiBS90_026207 [Biomphalaria glabrata]KAI8772729.1 hypothetical protein BgiBS90_026208 [Biomphalaria glabrata]
MGRPMILPSMDKARPSVNRFGYVSVFVPPKSGSDQGVKPGETKIVAGGAGAKGVSSSPGFLGAGASKSSGAEQVSNSKKLFSHGTKEREYLRLPLLPHRSDVAPNRLCWVLSPGERPLKQYARPDDVGSLVASAGEVISRSDSFLYSNLRAEHWKSGKN